MSRLNARPTHAAGDSWRKWEDPIVYRRPWAPDLGLWAVCIILGIVAGVGVGR